MQEYYEKMHSDGIIDQKIFMTFMLTGALIGLLTLVHRAISGTFGSIRSVFSFLLLSVIHGSFYLLQCHYQNDLTHLNGNVSHHSEFKVNNGKINATLVESLPHGLVFNFIINYSTTWFMMYVLFKSFKLDFSLYAGISSIVVPGKLLLQMKVVHPYIHAHNKSWYPYPLNLFFRDHYGHVICHHGSGYCLGDLPVVGEFHNALMFLHGKLYELGYLTHGSAFHFICNIIADYFLYFVTFAAYFACVALLSYLLPQKISNKSKAN
jgi:hypothetical protein